MKLSRNVRIGKNASALLLSQIGIRFMSLVFNAEIGKILGIEALGRYLSMLALEGLALAVISLGLNVYTTRELSRHIEKSHYEVLLGSIFGIRISAALLGTLVLNLGIAPLFYERNYFYLVNIVSFALLPDACIGVLGSIMRAKQRMEISSVIEMLGRLTAVSFGFVMLWKGFDEMWSLGAYVVGRLMTVLMYYVVILRWHIHVHWQFGKTWKGILSESLPFAIVDITALLYRKFDLLALTWLQGDAIAGIYGAAYSLWENLGLIPSSLLEALFPEIARRTQTETSERLINFYHKTRRVLSILVYLMASGFLIIAPIVINLLYGDMAGNMRVTSIFRGLLLGLPFTYLTLLDGNLLYALNRQKNVTRWMLVITVMNIILNMMLIPLWGSWAAMGVAIASCMALYVALHMETRHVLHLLKPGKSHENAASKTVAEI